IPWQTSQPVSSAVRFLRQNTPFSPPRAVQFRESSSMCGRKSGTSKALREPTKLTLRFTGKRAETPTTRKLKFTFLFDEVNRFEPVDCLVRPLGLVVVDLRNVTTPFCFRTSSRRSAVTYSKVGPA